MEDIDKRYYWFFCRSYEPPEKFNAIFDDCKNYAYIYHDKDGNEPHYHYLFQLKSNCTFRSFLCRYDVKMHAEICFSPLGSFEYLIHKNNPEKYQYLLENITALHFNKFLSLSLSGNDSAKNLRTMDLLQDIINNTPLDEMVYKYGRDYVLNYNKYHDFARRMSNSIQISNEEYLRLLDSVKDLHALRSLINCLEQDTIDESIIKQLKKM